MGDERNSGGLGRACISRARFLGLVGAAGLLAGCADERQDQRKGKGSATTSAKALANRDERWRPQFHFSPIENWMNDPNGLVYHRGEYHLFFQYNPKGSQPANQSWGHATSRDLFHWRELPVALRPDRLGLIFSGSAVVDGRDTSGFFGGKEGLVAAYTSAAGKDGQFQRQSIAHSKDNGETWTKYPKNPVIPNPKIKNFRDPKIIRHAPSSTWVMLLAAGDRILFYSSKNLKEWSRIGEFGAKEGAHGGVWETPELFELPVDGDPNETRWVLEVGTNPGALAGGSGGQYFVGRFDGETFKNENPPETTLWVDHGKDFYAAQSWSDTPASAGRLWIGWMNNWQYAEEAPTHPWRGAMSVPREVGLVRIPGEGVRLAQAPVAELERLRTRSRELKDIVVKPDENALPKDLGRMLGETFELVATFEPGTAREFGFQVRKKGNRKTVVGYDAKNARVFVDRTHSGVTDFGKGFPGKHEAPLRPSGGAVELRMLVDRSSVEVFGGGGTAVITDLIFPPKGATGLTLYARGGSARLASLSAHRLQSVWT